MKNNGHPFKNDFYALFAETQYWIYLFERQISILNRTILIKDIIIALFASTSAVSGLGFWETHLGKFLWGSGAFLAAVLSIVGPILKMNDKVLKYQENLTKYKELRRDNNVLYSKIKIKKNFSSEDFDTYQELQLKLENNNIDRPTIGLSLKKRKNIQHSVRNRMPKETFYFPEISK